MSLCLENSMHASVAANVAPVPWKPISCFGGGEGPQNSCREMPIWEPNRFLMGGGGPVAHPSDCFRQFKFNKREGAIYSHVCDAMHESES